MPASIKENEIYRTAKLPSFGSEQPIYNRQNIDAIKHLNKQIGILQGKIRDLEERKLETFKYIKGSSPEIRSTPNQNGEVQFKSSNKTIVIKSNGNEIDFKLSDITSVAGDFVRHDGTIPLSANWNSGSFKISAGTFESDVVTGTAPFTVASTTVVPNLNADLWDGYQFSDYLDQAVKVASTPTFAGVKTSKIYPTADATTALRITKADGVTNFIVVDTLNQRISIGTGGVPSHRLDILGDARMYSGSLLMNKISTSEFDGGITAWSGLPPYGLITNANTSWPFVLCAVNSNVNGCTIGAFKTRSSNTGGKPDVALQSGDEITGFKGQGADGSVYKASAWLVANVDGAVSSNIVPGRWTFWAMDTSGGFGVKMILSGTNGLSLPRNNFPLRLGAGNNCSIDYNATNMVVNPKLNGSGVVLIDTDSKICFRDIAIGIYSQADGYVDIFADTGLRIGDSSAGVPTNYTKFDNNGNISFSGSSGLYPRVLSQSAVPSVGTGPTQLDTGESCIWTDTDDSKCYLCYNHGGTVKKIELT